MKRFRVPTLPVSQRNNKRVGVYYLPNRHYFDPETRQWRHPADDYYYDTWYTNWCWYLFLFLFLAIFIVWIAAFWTHDGHSYHHHHPSDAVYANKRVRPKDCVTGEYWDNQVYMCAPKTPIPKPIVEEIKNTDVMPCDSFFNHMCGKWVDEHTNEDRSFTYLYHKNQIQIRDIVTNPESGPAYRLYRSCLDTLVYDVTQRQIQENTQIRHVMEYIHGSFKQMSDLPVVLARMAHYGITSPFVLSIEKNPLEPTMVPLLRVDDFPQWFTQTNATRIFQGDRTKSFRAWKVVQQLRAWHITSEPDNYMQYIQQQFSKDVYAYQKLHEMTSMPHFWTEYLRELDGHGLDAVRDAKEPFWVMNRPFFREFLSKLTTAFSLKEWQDYVELCIREAHVHFFPQLQDNVYFKLHDKQPYGSQVFLEHRLKQHPRGLDPNEAMCVQATHKLLPGVVANQYLHQYFNNEHDIRQQVTEVVTNIRDTFVKMVQETTWLDAATKDHAVEKLQNIIVRVIHPNTFGEEPFAARISQHRWLHNLNLIRRYRVERNLALWKSRDPLDRDTIQRFGMPLSETNAYYSPITNTITVFAGILRAPFYDAGFSLDAVYARVGSIVGHEISHSLDNHGRLWDKNGCFQNWWTPQAIEQFNRHAECVVQEYPAPTECDNPNYGQQTLGEDLSDITGVTLAYRAYFENTNEGRAKEPHERQYWWEMFAQMWCETLEMEHKCARVNQDVHAIGEMRVDQTLRQLRYFHTDYKCHATDHMVHHPSCVMFGQSEIN